jgi:hypothetical protein
LCQALWIVLHQKCLWTLQRHGRPVQEAHDARNVRKKHAARMAIQSSFVLEKMCELIKSGIHTNKIFKEPPWLLPLACEIWLSVAGRQWYPILFACPDHSNYWSRAPRSATSTQATAHVPTRSGSNYYIFPATVYLSLFIQFQNKKIIWHQYTCSTKYIHGALLYS